MRRYTLLLILILWIYSCQQELIILEDEIINSESRLHSFASDSAHVEHDIVRIKREHEDRIWHLDTFSCDAPPADDILVYGPVDPRSIFSCGCGAFHGCKAGHYFKGDALIGIDYRRNPDSLIRYGVLDMATYWQGFYLAEYFILPLKNIFNKVLRHEKIPLYTFNEIDGTWVGNSAFDTFNADIHLNAYEFIGDSTDNWIQFTYVDTVAGRLEGKMSLYLAVEDPENRVYDGNPDTFRIENIEFWARRDPE